MIDEYFIDILGKASKILFDRGFIGLYHGSISARNTYKTFTINTKGAFFASLDRDNLIELDFNHSTIWDNASKTANIHAKIYNKIPSAKFISSIFATSIVTASLLYKSIKPQDYHGRTIYKKIPIYDPKKFSDWEERAPHELSQYFHKNNTNIIVVKGVGIYCYDRNLDNMIRNIAIINKSCEVLLAMDSVRETSKA